MIFGRPIPFAEVIDLLLARDLLPTTLGFRDLQRLDAEIRRFSVFSAKVADARFLTLIDAVLERIITPTAEPGSYMNRPRAMDLLRGFLQEIGYTPDPAIAGGLQDLSSDQRLELIVRTQTELAQGYGQHVQANDPVAVDAFPCQELVRIQRVDEPRGNNGGNQFEAKQGWGGLHWPMRWRDAGGQFYGGGRMIARKDSPIWTAINRFGNPYPPFDFNSGMWVFAVPRNEAVRLGVIAAGDQVSPNLVPPRLPNEAGVKALTPAVLEKLQRRIPGAAVADGVLTTNPETQEE